MVLTFSGDLLNQIQVIHHQNQIEKVSSAKTLEFTINEWNNFSELNEIKYQNNYYDVISFKKVNSKIVANVVKDKFENETRVTISKIINKSKIPFSDKKKSNSFSKHLFSQNEFICNDILNLFKFKLRKFDRVLCSKIATYINFQEKPPC